MTPTEFQPFSHDHLTGHVHRDCDAAHLCTILREAVREEPVYAAKHWRRVYRTPSNYGTVYVKHVDETHHDKQALFSRFYSNEAKRTLHNYRLVTALGIHTPQLLMAAGERDRIRRWRSSIVITRELTGYANLRAYCEARSSSAADFREELHRRLVELADITARMHARGFYFSLDAGNVLFRDPPGAETGNVALIDLDHMSRTRFGTLPQRRVKRNLARFTKTARRLPGVTEDDVNLFRNEYQRAKTQLAAPNNNNNS